MLIVITLMKISLKYSSFNIISRFVEGNEVCVVVSDGDGGLLLILVEGDLGVLGGLAQVVDALLVYDCLLRSAIH